MTEYVVSVTKNDRGQSFPTEIRERVVRCRDCEHAVEHCDTDLLNCLHFEQWDYYYDQPGEWMVEPDGFCAWGEPRKEEP